jgi:hypothetical protein
VSVLSELRIGIPQFQSLGANHGPAGSLSAAEGAVALNLHWTGRLVQLAQLAACSFSPRDSAGGGSFLGTSKVLKCRVYYTVIGLTTSVNLDKIYVST